MPAAARREAGVIRRYEPLHRHLPELLQDLSLHRDESVPGEWRHVEPAHFRLMMACAEMCLTSAHFMLINTPHHKPTCEECAEICVACAEDCQRIVAMCRVCAASCSKMAAGCRTIADEEPARFRYCGSPSPCRHPRRRRGGLCGADQIRQ